MTSLHWRHNDYGGVSNHQPHDCLLNRLFRRRLKKTSKLRVTGLCAGNSPGPVNSPHKGPVTRKMFPFDDVIMVRSTPRCGIVLQSRSSTRSVLLLEVSKRWPATTASKTTYTGTLLISSIKIRYRYLILNCMFHTPKVGAQYNDNLGCSSFCTWAINSSLPVPHICVGELETIETPVIWDAIALIMTQL